MPVVGVSALRALDVRPARDASPLWIPRRRPPGRAGPAARGTAVPHAIENVLTITVRHRGHGAVAQGGPFGVATPVEVVGFGPSLLTVATGLESFAKTLVAPSR